MQSMESILATNELSVKNFEDAVAVGMKPFQICKMFNITSKELDEWCMKEYGQNLSTAYEMLKQLVYREFLTTVKNLGYRGNPTALGIINDAINDMKKEQVTRIVFANSVPTESAEDSEDDGN